MATHNAIQVLHAELVQANDFCVRTERWGHQPPSSILAFHVCDDLCKVLAIQASPICVGQQVRAAQEEDLNAPRAGLYIGFMPHLDQISCHSRKSSLKVM